MTMMLPAARKLARDGYRVVLVDLRGCGRSSGEWISWGGIEIHDMSQLLDELHRRGLADDRVGVVGFSYGGSLGIQLAAVDRRVKAVVALRPSPRCVRNCAS